MGREIVSQTMGDTNSAEIPYRGDAAEAYHVQKRAIPPVAIPWVCRARAGRIQPWVRSTDVVFEFGCGWGWNLGALKCARRLGHDISSIVAPAVSALGIEFIPELSGVADASCDLIVCHHVLEHVLEPATTLNRLRKFIRKDGTLLAVVPYEYERRYRRFDPSEPNHHLHAWNIQTFCALLTVCGWRPQKWRLQVYGYDRRAAKIAAKAGLGENGFRTLRRCLQWLRPLREICVVATDA